MIKYYVIKLCCSDCKKFLGFSVEYSQNLEFLLETLNEEYYYVIFDSNFNYIDIYKNMEE